MSPALIPWPNDVTMTGAGYVLGSETRVAADPTLASVVAILRNELDLPLQADSAARLRLELDASLATESYRLDVDEQGVRIVGGDAAGVFYATRTLHQLTDGRTLPGVSILDGPAFGWRGSMLDVGRHFMPKEFVLRYIDLLAAHKLNVLHLHLTEDHGWRIEIRRYPKLTEVGAWRPETMIGRPDGANSRYDGVPHGGFYSQDDIREIVAYGASRFVRVMPEIEVPGHSRAAIAAYPELGNGGEPIDVGRGWGIETHVLNVEESTVRFFENVYDEIFELFPSTFIHVGGDECPKTEWRDSPRTQQLLRERGLQDDEQLQSWFISRLDRYFAERGRRLVGWDEILDGGLADGATVMSWRGEKGGIVAAEAGHDVVMAPTSHTYFDYYQSEDTDSEPLAIGGFVPLATVYGYQPVPRAMSADAAHHVLGSQFQLWTEYMPTPHHVEYMAFPRACAFAEAVWSMQRPGYADFGTRLRPHLDRLAALGVNSRPPEDAGAR